MPDDEHQPHTVASVLTTMQARLETLPQRRQTQRAFLETYRRTTAAVGDAIARARSRTPGWVEAWDVAFARLYLDALDAHVAGARRAAAMAARVRRAGRPAAAAPRAARHQRARQLRPAAGAARRDHRRGVRRPRGARLAGERDHERDRRRARRPGGGRGRRAGRAVGPHPARPGAAAAEPAGLPAVPARGAARRSGTTPASCRRARLAGPDAYAARLAELEVLSAARIADLLAPGQVLLRLAVAGFGVVLPPPARS